MIYQLTVDLIYKKIWLEEHAIFQTITWKTLLCVLFTCINYLKQSEMGRKGGGGIFGWIRLLHSVNMIYENYFTFGKTRIILSVGFGLGEWEGRRGREGRDGGGGARIIWGNILAKATVYRKTMKVGNPLKTGSWLLLGPDLRHFENISPRK